MSVLVVGSIALDTVKTPFGEATDAVGGSGVYFAAGASFFTPVNVVGVVGQDFPMHSLDFLKARGVDLHGLSVKPGKTFRWSGVYGFDLNVRETLDTQLNAFATFKPSIPDVYRKTDYVFLANIDPELQLDVLRQVERPRLVVCDTMDFWIEGKRDALLRTLQEVDVLILNDAETRELAEEADLIKAARRVLTMGPKTVVVKKGEHGALLISSDAFFAAPAFPTESVFDPTGAGDSFAGGFVGHLARTGDLSHETMRQAVIYGSVIASFNVERFSMERLKSLSQEEIRERFRAFQKITHFDE
ncbi:MAG: sugar kinase [Candidatus Latescibacteria bacterium]|nr:sugar kinase [Candidatus Latescibacterota bacterium]